MEREEMMRKLRSLKRLEAKLRFGDRPPEGARYVWDRFFELREPPRKGAKYTLRDLLRMEKAEYKKVIDVYFAAVYYEHYAVNSLGQLRSFDPAVLEKLDLPYDADRDAIKARFRELAKRFHPDTGGDAERFIRLMEVYRALLEKGE